MQPNYSPVKVVHHRDIYTTCYAPIFYDESFL